MITITIPIGAGFPSRKPIYDGESHHGYLSVVPKCLVKNVAVLLHTEA